MVYCVKGLNFTCCLCWLGIGKLDVMNEERKFFIFYYPAMTLWNRKLCITTGASRNSDWQHVEKTDVDDPTDQTMMHNSETDSELYTLSETFCRMEELAEGRSCYTQNYLKVKLEQYYVQYVFSAEQPRRILSALSTWHHSFYVRLRS